LLKAAEPAAQTEEPVALVVERRFLPRLQRQAPLQAVALPRPRMKMPRVRRLDPSEGQKRARSIITGAATREARWGPIIAALHLVFGSICRRLTPTQLQSLLLSRRRSTGRRPYGGPATMIMRPVNGGVGVPGMAGMGGVPGITATEGQRDNGRSSVLS
jgi:hypothetical protein